MADVSLLLFWYNKMAARRCPRTTHFMEMMVDFSFPSKSPLGEQKEPSEKNTAIVLIFPGTRLNLQTTYRPEKRLCFYHHHFGLSATPCGCTPSNTSYPWFTSALTSRSHADHFRTLAVPICYRPGHHGQCFFRATQPLAIFRLL